MEEEGRLSQDAGVLWGSRDGVGTLQARKGTWAPREPRVKPEVWPQGLLLPPQAPAMGPGPAHSGTGSAQVDAFCGHQGQGATDSFLRRGFELWGTEVKAVTLPSWVV